MPNALHSTQKLDTVAISLSAICLAHCLALPLLAVWLPTLSLFSEQEWVHRLIVCIAVPISLLAVFKSGTGQFAIIFTCFISLGLSALLVAAFIEHFHDYEAPLTIFGALLVSFSHALRWNHHRPQHE